MKLSDVMSRMGLANYAEVGLLIFFVVFVGVMVHVIRRDRREYDHASRLPLDDGDSTEDRS